MLSIYKLFVSFSVTTEQYSDKKKVQLAVSISLAWPFQNKLEARQAHLKCLN